MRRPAVDHGGGRASLVLRLRIHHRLLLPVIGSFVVLLVLATVGDRALHRHVQAAVENDVIAKIAEIDSHRRLVERSCLAQAALFSRVPFVQRAYALALSGNIDDEDDPKVEEARTLLRRELAPFIRGFRKVTEQERFRLHFHLPNGRSLLRAWQPEQHRSDDISSFRRTVVQINHGRHEPITGVEVGRGGFAIRGIAPVTGPDGQHLGSVEVLTDFTPLILAARENDRQAYAVFMNADLLSIATRLQDRHEHPVLHERWVLVATTGQEKILNLASDDILEQGARGRITRRRGSYEVTAFPISDFGGRQVGVVLYALDDSARLADLFHTRLKLYGISLSLAILLGFWLLRVGRSITLPLGKALQIAEAVAAGDLSQRPDFVNRDDEVGELGAALDRMIEGLRAMVDRIRAASGSLREAIDGLTEQAGALSSSSRKLSTVSGTVSQASEGLSTGMGEIATSSEAMFQMIHTVAAAIEEMRASIQEVTGNVARSSEMADDARERATAAVEVMGALERASTKIGKVLDVITDIADQTNLLALNATIEAASAGEAGKGFAVVANEVKNLARQTAGATEEIAREIEEMRKSTTDVTRAMSRVSEVIHSLSELATSIAAAMEEQSATVSEIARSGEAASSAAREISQRVEEGAKSAQEISREMGKVRAAAEQTDGEVRSARETASRLSELAGELDQIVSRFRGTAP